jgi:hypothetical protein
MAIELLNTGSTSLASGNWKTLAGAAGSGIVDDAELLIQNGTQAITSDITWTSLTNGIKYLDISPGFAGNIAGGTSGSLAFQTRNSLFSQVTQLPRVRYEASGGTLYYTAENASANDEVHYLQVNGAGSLYVTGTCSVRRLELNAGRVIINQNVGSVANYRWVFTGGTSTIDIVNSGGTNDIHALTITGGQHLLKRGIQGTTITAGSRTEGLHVAGGAVTIDAGSRNISAMTVSGGTTTVLNAGNPDTPTAGITNLLALGGTIDFSRLARPMIITLVEDAPSCTIIPSKYLTITTRNPIGPGADGLN